MERNQSKLFRRLIVACLNCLRKYIKMLWGCKVSLDDIILISIELSIPVVGGILFIAPIAIFVHSLMKKRKKLFIGACVAVFFRSNVNFVLGISQDLLQIQ